MGVEPTLQSPSADDRTGVGELRWPAVYAFITAWLLPATTARRTAHVRLLSAYVVHLAAILITALLIVVMVAWDDSRRRDQGIILATSFLLATLEEEAARDPAEFAVAVGSGLLGIEVITVAGALLVTSWGARDEPFGRSIANGFRRVWLHGCHLVPLTLLLGVFMHSMWAADERWHSSAGLHPPSMAYPNYPTQPAGKEVMAAYEAEVQRASDVWNVYHQELYRRMPWYVRYRDEIVGYAVFGGITWFLWALFRAVAARADAPPVARPPLCESCGYNLTGAAGDGRCPECGGPVADSLGPGVRPGAAWERRREVGRLAAWWRCAEDSIRRPHWFGRQVRVTVHAADHRVFLAVNLALVFVGGATGVFASVVADRGLRAFRAEPEFIWIVGPMVGWFSAAIGLGITCLTAGVVGLYYRYTTGRNLLSGGIQIACYLSAYLVLWVLLAAGITLQIAHSEELFAGIGMVLGIPGVAVGALYWLAVNGAAALGYLWLVFKGTGALRYANR